MGTSLLREALKQLFDRLFVSSLVPRFSSSMTAMLSVGPKTARALFYVIPIGYRSSMWSISDRLPSVEIIMSQL